MASKTISKVPKGMKKLSPEKKEDKLNKPYKWDPRPCLTVEQKDLPAMADWEVGKEYDLVVRVKMEDYSSSMDSDSGETKTRGSFRVTAIGVEEKD